MPFRNEQEFFPPKLEDPLIWVEVRKTGLNPAKGQILEIAIIVTDGNLSTKIDGPDYYIKCDPKIMEDMDKDFTRKHTESGLIDAVKNSYVHMKDAEDMVLHFLEE